MSKETAVIEAHSLWWRERGSNEGYELLECMEHGMGDIPLQEKSSTTTFGRNCNGVFEPVATSTDPPGDLPESQIDFYEVWNQIHPLLQAFDEDIEINFERLRYSTPNNMDVRQLAKQADYFGLRFTGGTRGAAPNLTGEGGPLASNVTVSILESLMVQLDLSLSAQTLTETDHLLSGMMLSRNIDRDTGYRGPDRVGYIGVDTEATPTAPGPLLLTVDGGGTWTAMTNPPFPDNRGVSGLAWQPLTETSFRLFALGGTLTGSPGIGAYYDIQFGQEDDAALTPNAVAFPGSSNGDAGTAVLWPAYGRLYAAVGTDLFISSDAGATFPATPAVAPAQTINDIIEDSVGNVWIVTDNDGILVERKATRGTFEAAVGPGAGNLTAITRAGDGAIYVGAGNTIYRSDDEARGSWTLKATLPVGATVRQFYMPKNFSEVVYAAVNTSAPVGSIYRTIDGGLTWTPFLVSTNTGYNGIIPTANINRMFVFGQDGKLEILG